MWIDLAQLTVSRLQRAVWLTSVLSVAWLLCLSGLLWPIKLLSLVALLMFSLLHRRWRRQQPSFCALQQLDRDHWQWRQHPDARNIQARLLRVEAWCGVVVILHFEITALGKRQTWLIWRDQVDMDNWRRLQVLQQYWAAPLVD